MKQRIEDIIKKQYTKDYNKGKAPEGTSEYFWRVNDVRLPRDVAQAYAYYRNGKRLENILPTIGDIDKSTELENKLKEGEDTELRELYNKGNYPSKLEEPENMTDDFYDDYLTDANTYNKGGGTTRMPSVKEEGFEDYLRSGSHIAAQYISNLIPKVLGLNNEEWDMMYTPSSPYEPDYFGKTTAGRYARAKMQALLDKNSNGNISKKEIKQAVKEEMTPEEKAEIKGDIEEAVSNEDSNAKFREPTGMYNTPAAMAEIFKNNREVSDERCKEMRRKSIEKMKNGWGETDVMKKKKKEEEKEKGK